jgi:hypothetical protein
MTKNAILTKFISMLGSFTDEELRGLVTFLENEQSRNALIHMVQNVTQIRNVHQDTYEHTNFQKSHGPGIALSEQLNNGTAEKVREMFFSYFSNKNHYQSVRDVINALNSSFKCQIDYDVNQKRGRRDVISKCWSALSKLPDEERFRMLSLFFKNEQHDDNLSAEYKKLFKILTRNE